MTDKHHPVTREELNQIKNDCAYPERLECWGCGFHIVKGVMGAGCSFKGANVLMDEVLPRPDSLALLEAWRYQQIYNHGTKTKAWNDETCFITRLREDPEADDREWLDKNGGGY